MTFYYCGSTLTGGTIMNQADIEDDNGSWSPTDHDDKAVLRRFGWLTPRRIIYSTFAWLILFSLGSIGVANPFEDERTATSTINYWHVMYLHGMLIGMVGITLLLSMMVFQIRWKHAWWLVPLGVVVATLFDTVGGIFDHRIPGDIGDKIATWTQILGFFTLDEMLIVTAIAFFLDWRAKTSRQLSYLLAWAADISMLFAAVMGHLAGWILEFGDHPSFIGSFAHFEGENVKTLTSNLITSHSHEMTVAFMVMVIATGVRFFAERQSTAGFAILRRVGLLMALIGTIGFTAVYLWSGFTDWTIPTLFTSNHGVNGVALDDLITGFGMLGGLVGLAGAFLAKAAKPVLPVFGAAWSWLLTISLVVASGYWIELHETHFGAGAVSAPGAKSDAVFTWFHQDVGLFLFPMITVTMLITARYVIPKYQGVTALAAVIGSTLLFAGGMVYIFVDSQIHGTGYVLSTIGLLTIGASFLSTIWWGFVKQLHTA